MSETAGISMRFVKGWDLVPDSNPLAFSILVCPDCLAVFEGAGKSLIESVADAEELRRAHGCSHLQRTGDEPV